MIPNRKRMLLIIHAFWHPGTLLTQQQNDEKSCQRKGPLTRYDCRVLLFFQAYPTLGMQM